MDEGSKVAKFKPGQIVEFVRRSFARPDGPYEVVRQLPSETDEPRYRLRSIHEPHERMAVEHELRPADS